jgi:hypothetical protein
MTEEENLSKLVSLFGEAARSKVILATTRWNIKMDEVVRANREEGLSEEWETVCRLDDSVESAWKLVEIVLGRYASEKVPQLQDLSHTRNDSGRGSALGPLIPWFRQLLGRD